LNASNDQGRPEAAGLHSGSLNTGRLLSEPLDTWKIAKYFGVGRHRVPDLIEGMAGVERIGRRFRLPLEKMPPRYLLAVGLIVPATGPIGSKRDCSTN
jgi:hypothetical protein